MKHLSQQQFLPIFVCLASTMFQFALGGTNTWPCISGKCHDNTNCPTTGDYGCPPPECTGDTDCDGLRCEAATAGPRKCVDGYPERSPANAACDRHSACEVSFLCTAGTCQSSQTVGTFAICSTNADCPDMQECDHYTRLQTRSGVCLKPTKDPQNQPLCNPGQIQEMQTQSLPLKLEIVRRHFELGPNRATNCEAHRTLCNNELYQPLMKQMCAQTCRTAGVDLRCVDQSPNCPRWRTNGFCDQAFYTVQMKRDRCMKSCNLCQQPQQANLG